jgi:glycerophosphoryl diester phosphodiesterase
MSPQEFRAQFVKPIAHRGFHDALTRIENTSSAFEAGLSRGYGVECDLQPAVDGTPVVFHDETVERLMEGSGRVDQMSVAQLKALKYRQTSDRMITLAEFLALANGRGPLLIEIKTTWGPIPEKFLSEIARHVSAYKGPAALMSFDPAAIEPMKTLAPNVPRGIVSGVYREVGWWLEKIGVKRGAELTRLADLPRVGASFAAYHVKALPSPTIAQLRQSNLPAFTWTVRTADDLAAARQFADAPIFEHIDPVTGALLPKG